MNCLAAPAPTDEGKYDNRNVIVTATLQLANKVDNNTKVQMTVQIVNPGGPNEPDDPIGEPGDGNFEP